MNTNCRLWVVAAFAPPAALAEMKAELAKLEAERRQLEQRLTKAREAVAGLPGVLGLQVVLAGLEKKEERLDAMMARQLESINRMLEQSAGEVHA